MNKILLYSLFLFFLLEATGITKNETRFVSEKSNTAHLMSDAGFEKLKDNEYFKIHDYDVSHVLHANHDTVKNFGVYGRIPHVLHKHMVMADASMHESAKKGAEIGFWVSKFAVHIIAQTVYALVAGAASMVYPAAAPIVYCSLQLTFAALIEIASNIIASGIIALR